MKPELERIPLGSGKLYCTEYAKGKPIPDDATIETEDNLLGWIQGGASLEYKPKFYEATDDLGYVKKTIITDEDVTLKSGVLTWNGNTLMRVSSTARVTESGGKRTVKIGGLSNYSNQLYVIRFVHSDKEEGDIRITVVGNNQAGFTLKFAKDKETVVDAEFKAAPLDKEGTLVIYEESILGVAEATGLTVTSVEGGTTGKTTITVTPSKGVGNTYKYTTGATVVVPTTGQDSSTLTGYQSWDGSAEITATTGEHILVVEIDALGKVVKAGQVIIASKS